MFLMKLRAKDIYVKTEGIETLTYTKDDAVMLQTNHTLRWDKIQVLAPQGIFTSNVRGSWYVTVLHQHPILTAPGLSRASGQSMLRKTQKAQSKGWTSPRP